MSSIYKYCICSLNIKINKKSGSVPQTIDLHSCVVGVLRDDDPAGEQVLRGVALQSGPQPRGGGGLAGPALLLYTQPGRWMKFRACG